MLPVVQHVYVISDLHTDQPDNFAAVQEFAAQPESALLVAGDVSESLEVLAKTFTVLLSKFKVVCFVAGNHDLWVERERRATGTTSCDKHKEVMDCCARLGVYTAPVKVNCQE